MGGFPTLSVAALSFKKILRRTLAGEVRDTKKRRREARYLNLESRRWQNIGEDIYLISPLLDGLEVVRPVSCCNYGSLVSDCRLTILYHPAKWYVKGFLIGVRPWINTVLARGITWTTAAGWSSSFKYARGTSTTASFAGNKIGQQQQAVGSFSSKWTLFDVGYLWTIRYEL